MTEADPGCVQLCLHSLVISDPQASLDFYQRVIGMCLQREAQSASATHYFLGFEEGPKSGTGCLPGYPRCYLELVFDPKRPAVSETGGKPGYWKIALSVADLDIAREHLIANRIDVGAAFQVPDVAYLCHFVDPDGYCIELIQHRFRHHHQAHPPDPNLALGNLALGTTIHFLLVTYRVRDPASSLDFYCGRLGLRLLSKQVVVAHGFTLYFLSCDAEDPPTDAIEDIDLREWLWQRPYALIELQHVWGTEQDPEFAYDVSDATGFRNIALLARNPTACGQSLELNAALQREVTNLTDPDGYRIELISMSPTPT